MDAGDDMPSAVDAPVAGDGAGGGGAAGGLGGGSGPTDASESDRAAGGSAAAAGGGGAGGAGGAGGRGVAGGGGTGGLGGAADAGSRDASDAPASGDGAARDAAADTTATDAGKACAVCAAWGSPAAAGHVTGSALNNLSGMAVSRRNAGVLYVHNDMTRQEFFAVSESGALLGTYAWTGTTVDDMEDMAVGHCPSGPAGSCVYLADIGGNLAPRTTFAIVRTPEPAVTVGQAAVTSAVTVERLAFSYEDGAHNAESLLVDPGSDNLYVVTKPDAGPATVYRVTGAFGGAAVVAHKIADLTVPKSTDRQTSAASAHPCGAGFLLRTYNTLYEFRVAPGAPFESAFAVAPVAVPVATETQGEAVAYAPDGLRYFTTGEGSMPALNRVDCAGANL
jgi:hypothetical protein